MPLERPGTVSLDRAEWLILEAQVLRSWSRETRTHSRVLAAQAHQGRRDARSGSTRLAAALRESRTGQGP